ncbi:MAG: class I SAM-dependent RNA methyltransferase [Deltaproteobacteria bacterium]|nr:MAG: class I SAM-dependent RNA methyltransferase [Deltaproteobacteria bacterium]
MARRSAGRRIRAERADDGPQGSRSGQERAPPSPVVEPPPVVYLLRSVSVETATIHLRTMAHGGLAVGHPTGEAASLRDTWFVAGALPHERVRALAERRRRGAVFARAVEILQASSDRREPPCALAGVCGGCDWLFAAPDAQARFRRQVVSEQLRRIAGLEGVQVGTLAVGEAPELGYRRRVKMHYLRGEDGAFRLGFRRAGAHVLEDVTTCPVLTGALDAAMQRVRALADRLPRQGNVFGLDVGGRVVLGLSGVRPTPEIVARCEAMLDELVVGIELRGGRMRRHVGVTRCIVDRDASGTGVRVGPFSFVQANAEVNAALVERVRAHAAGDGRVLELYAGAGNLTRAWACRSRRGMAVEYDREAAKALGNLVRARRWPVAVRRGRAERVVAALRGEGERFAATVVDPPRAGLGEKLVADVCAVTEDVVVYVSCDAATFARDAKAFRGHGFELERVEVADMMPQTSHAELVGLFRGTGRRS